MGIAVLGPLQVDGHPDGLSPRDWVVLSALVVRARESVSTEALADALWGDQVPVSWATVVHGCVWRLRKALGSAAIDTSPTGYMLTLSDDELDHRVFERLLERGREALDSGHSTRSSFLLAEGLGLWRGRALAELQEWEPGRVEAARLEGMRMDAEELRVEAEVRAGRALAVLERARALVAEEPFRERRWALLTTALYQSGRQREALAAVKRARTLLVEELGLDPGRELVDLEQRLLRHDPSLTPGEAGEPSPVCPYRGLQPYDAEHADTFFGREDDLAACLRRLRDSGVLAVVGPSGVGKSSLVRAGVVAALTSSDTPVLLTTPGARPLDSLKALKPRGRQTLVVDQAEEAVTLCSDPAEQADYFTALASHVGGGGGLVVSLRADHVGDLVPYSDIARTLEEGLYLLGPMREPALRRAIEGPARRAGLRLEAGLVDLLVRDVEGQPAGLPMLSHVLRETWERREGSTLTIDGYKATGGIQHAVSQSAETLYDAMDEAQRGRLRSLLLRLVMPTEDGEPVRARVARDRVTADEPHRQLVEQLVGARLLSIDGDTVQIAHEALVRVWPRLRGWLDDDIEGQRLFRHLAGAAEAWDGMGRPDSELYRRARLSRTLEWRDRSSTDLTDAEAAFLSASVSLSEKELRATEAQVTRERQVSRRLRRALAGVAGLLVVSLVTGALALHSADQAGDQRAKAERLAAIADAGRVSAQARNQEDLDTSILLQLAALRIDGSSAQAREGLAVTLGGPWPQQIKAPTGASGNVRSVAVSGDGKLVASSDPVDGVQLYDAATMSPVAFADDTPASVVRFSPDGTLLAAAVNGWRPQPSWHRIVDLPVRLYDLPSGTLSTRQLGGWPAGASVEYSLAFSRDGRRIVAGVNRWDETTHDWTTGAVMVWDVATPAEPVFEVALPDEALATLSPDGRLVFTATKGEQPLRVYDVASGRELGSSPSPVVGSEGATDLEVSPDGSTLAVGARGQVLLLDASTLTATRPALTGHAGAVRVAYSHDGSLLLSMSVDSGDGILWDTDTWTERRRLVGHVSIEGSRLAAPHPDGGVALLDPATWTWTGAGWWSTEFEARNLAYSPDGSQVATAEAGWIRIWDGRTGAYVAGIPLPGPSSTAMVAYRADGTGLLVAARDGRTWIVDTRLSTWVDRACDIAGRNLTREEWQQYLPNQPYVVTCPQWPADT